MTDIVSVVGVNYSFVALRKDGTLVYWGAGFTELPPALSALSDVVFILGSSSGLIAMRKDGSVVRWDVFPSQILIPEVRNVQNITLTSNFTMLLITSDSYVQSYDENGILMNIPGSLQGNISFQYPDNHVSTNLY